MSPVDEAKRFVAVLDSICDLAAKASEQAEPFVDPAGLEENEVDERSDLDMSAPASTLIMTRRGPPDGKVDHEARTRRCSVLSLFQL